MRRLEMLCSASLAPKVKNPSSPANGQDAGQLDTPATVSADQTTLVLPSRPPSPPMQGGSRHAAAGTSCFACFGIHPEVDYKTVVLVVHRI